jgi:hypothetical protein
MPRRYANAQARRDRDREIQRLAANRRIGHDHAYLIVFGMPILRVLVPLLGIALAAAWMWFYVDHKLIGMVAAVGGIAMVLAYAANLIGTGGTTRKNMALATGRRVRPLWWHGVGAAGVVLLALAYVAVPR